MEEKVSSDPNVRNRNKLVDSNGSLLEVSGKSLSLGLPSNKDESGSETAHVGTNHALRTRALRSNNSSLFVESEQKINENAASSDPSLSKPSERPTSAGRERTPPEVDGGSTGRPVNANLKEIANFRNIVTFESNLQDAYPEKTDSETNLIIQHLKAAIDEPSPEENLSSDNVTEETFATLVPEEELEEARRKQERRKLKRETEMWRTDDFVTRKSMQEVLDEKTYQHYSRGVLQASEGQFEAAITSFTKALNLQPMDLSCYVERGEAYLQLCDFRSAYLNYKKAHCLEPHNSFIYDKLAFVCYLEGQCLFDQCLYVESLECFTRAAEMKPSVPGYHLRAITCLAALGRHQECLALVTRRLETEAMGNPELYVLRARLHLKFGNATLCYYDVRDALSLDSEQAQALDMMAEIRRKAEKAKADAVELTLQNKLVEARNKVSIAVETDPSVPEYHVFRGALHRRLEDFNAAIDDYLLAMDKSDHDEAAPVYQAAQRQLLLTYNDFAVRCYHKGFYEEAVILLNKAVKGEKQEKGLYINRGDCFFKLNDLGFALADYQQALEINPTCWATKCRIAVVHNEYGITAYQERSYREAVERFSLAIDHNPKVGQFYVHRSRSHYMLQDVEDARMDILISLHLDPNNEELIPLLSRLFPGRSMKEVLQSKLAEVARHKITSSIGPRGPLPPMTRESLSKRKSARLLPTALSNTSATSLARQESREETSDDVTTDDRLATAELGTPQARVMLSDKELIKQKNNVADELHGMFRFSKSLKYTGPRISSRPTLPTQNTPESDTHRKGYHWQKFGGFGSTIA